MKKGQGTRAGGYFRQIAMPLNSPLPVLRPARRWPVRPGEDRIRPEKFSTGETSPPSRGMKQNLPQLGPPGALGGQQEPASDETESFRAEAPRPSASPEIAAPILTRSADSQTKNQSPSPIYKDAGKSPVHPSAESFGTMSSGETASSSATSTKGEQIAEANLARISSPVVDASASRRETARVSESFTKPIYEINAADDAGNRPLEFQFEDETRPAAPRRMSGRQDKIEIGSIEVRIVNPSPALPAVAPPPPRLRPMAGGTTSSSGSLARGLRGPWGLRQG